jgi:hypothetical protein
MRSRNKAAHRQHGTPERDGKAEHFFFNSTIADAEAGESVRLAACH